jgi:hypothetical protein
MRGFVHSCSSLKPREAGIAVQFSRQVRQRKFTATPFCFVCFTRRARKRMQLVRYRTAQILSIENILIRRRGAA